MINCYSTNRGRVRTPPITAHQAGLTLVELMVSITLGLFVVLAATALLLSTKSGYAAQEEGARIQDTGRYAIEILARAVRQAAYENWDREEAPIAAAGSFSANLAGLDSRSLKEKTDGIESPLAESINGSDVLAVRFFGSGTGKNGDETILNCAGFGVPAVTSMETAEADRGWSIFYVARDAGGEPALYCKYSGEKEWASDPIAGGVESFQVLYGLDTDADGLPNQFLTATGINTLDDQLTLEGSNPEAQTIDKNRKSNWKKVVAIKVALLVRGSQNARSDASTDQYDLFGKDYANAHASTDIGTRIKAAALPNRVRRLFTAVIQVRNQSSGSAT
jgi:type IV pilus assembly protein PilW